MNRIDRLFALTLQLQRKPRVTAAELAATFGVSERTIYRDMQALVEIGLPIASMPGEGYHLLDTYRLPPLMLKQEEAVALFLSGKMLQQSAAGRFAEDIEQALGKLHAVLPRAVKQEVEALTRLVDFFPMPSPFDWDDRLLRRIVEATEQQQVLHITYRGYLKDEITERDVEPHSLMFSDGVWYIVGYCHLRESMRHFRLNRIHSLTVLPDVFQRREIQTEPQKTIEVHVRFAEQMLPILSERQHYGYSHTTEAGDFVYHVHDLTEIRGWLLGFGAQAEVLSPKVLRSWLRNEAEKLISLLT